MPIRPVHHGGDGDRFFVYSLYCVLERHLVIMLYHAAADAETDVVELFLDKGADINARANDLETPLHKAVFREDNFKLLLARGAEPDPKTRLGNTPQNYIEMSSSTNDSSKKEMLETLADARSKQAQSEPSFFGRICNAIMPS